jgi:serine/threonine-protein kinase HipA
MDKQLDVYLGHHLVGHLSQTQSGNLEFIYVNQWLDNEEAIPLSLSLPLQSESFNGKEVRAFFNNLLPEAYIRQVVANKLGISYKNDYALLEAIGGECAGAVMVLPHQQKVNLSGEYRLLSDDQLAALPELLVDRPFEVGEKGVRLSLAGAQTKLPVYVENQKIFLPIGSNSSSHILKPPLTTYPNSVENEAFCMRLAKRLDLPVPMVDVISTPCIFYLIERYDRWRDKNGIIKRLHQEDFCQALGIIAENKYENEGGPKLAQCFEIIKTHSVQPAIDQKHLLKWVIYNYLIGNADGHAKNLSLLLLETGPKLAPFYDLLCTTVYPELSKNLAMKIGDEHRLKWITNRHWERFAAEIQIKPQYVFKELHAMAAVITSHAEQLMHEMQQQSLDITILKKIVAFIRKQADHINHIQTFHTS